MIPTSSRPDANSSSSLAPHGDGVTCVSMTPDGQHAVSGSFDRTLRVWDLEGGACLATFDDHRGAVASLSLTPDGTRAVSGSADHTVRVWDLGDGGCLAVIPASAPVAASAVSDRRVVFGTASGTVAFADLLPLSTPR
jgi:WD40 repeat protein